MGAETWAVLPDADGTPAIWDTENDGARHILTSGVQGWVSPADFDVIAGLVAEASTVEPAEAPIRGSVSCPSCGKAAYLWPALDRYLHCDGSSNQACWLQALRGAAA